MNIERKMPSNMSHNFSSIENAKVPRSTFKRDFTYKTTFNAGYLIPFFCDIMYPGDSVNMNSAFFARLTTMIKAPMDNLYMDVHYFAVPIRLVHDNFRKLMGEQVDPDDSTDYLLPVFDKTKTPLSSTGWQVHSPSDYLGIPCSVVGIEHVSIFHRAYNFIYNEWYRPQDLIDSVVVDTDDGPDNPADYNTLLKRAKRHDYFTSCLPWPQKTNTTDYPNGVVLPLGTSAPIKGLVAYGSNHGLGSDSYDSTGAMFPAGTRVYPASVTGYVSILDAVNSSGTAGSDGHQPNVWADLSLATAATINQLRQTFALQHMLERDARGGTRYSELVKSRFGVTFQDIRYHPELLSTHTINVNINPVIQNSESGTTKQGNIAGFGTIIGNGGFTKSFSEHTIVLGILSVRADLTYQQGLWRIFSDRERFEMYEPAMAHLGEQAVLLKELYLQGTADDDTVFGYQEAWSHLRYYPSRITGKLNSTYSAPLDAWHLSQEFGSKPTLGQTFIEETPPMSRILAVTNEADFILDSFHKYIHVRPLPVYSIPGFIDHF